MADQVIRVDYDVSKAAQAADKINKLLSDQGIIVDKITRIYEQYNRKTKQTEAIISGMTKEGKEFRAVLNRMPKLIQDNADKMDLFNRKVKLLQAALNKLAKEQENLEKSLASDIFRDRERQLKRLEKLERANQSNILKDFKDREKAIQALAREEEKEVKSSIKIHNQKEKFIRDSIKRQQASIREAEKIDAKEVQESIRLNQRKERFIRDSVRKRSIEFRRNVGERVIQEAGLGQISGFQRFTSSPEQLAKIALSLERIKVAFAQGKIGSDDFRVALDAIANKSFANLTKSQLEAVKHIQNYNKAVDQLGKGSKQVEAVTISWQGLLRIFQVQVLHSIIARLITSLENAVEESRKFQIAIAEIQTISQDAQLSTQKWTNGILELSAAFGKTPADVAQAAYDAISNQVTKGAETFRFLNDALKLATTTQSSTTESVNLLSSVINAYNLEVSKASEITSVFFKAVDLGRFKVSDLSDDFGHTAVLARDLGVSYQEVTASLVNLTRQGLSADEAQTLLSNVIIQLIKPSEALKKLFDEWGTSTGQLAVETFGFFNVLRKIEKAAAEGRGFDDIADFFKNIRAIRGVSGLTSTLDGLEKDLEQITNATNELDKAMEIISNSTGKKMEVELKEINKAMLQLGMAINETTLSITDSFGGLSEVVTGLLYNLHQFVELVIGPAGLAIALGFAALKIQSLIASLKVLHITIATHPILAIAAVLTTLVALTESYAEQNLRLARTFERLEERINKAYDKDLAERIKKLKDETQDLVDSVKNTFRGLLQLNAELNKTNTKVSKDLEAALNLSNKILDVTLDKTRDIADEVVDAVKEAAKQAAKEAADAQKEIEKLQKSIFDRTEKFRQRVFDEELKELSNLEKKKKLEESIKNLQDSAEQVLNLPGNLPENFEEATRLLDEAEKRLEQLRDVQQQLNKEVEKESEERQKILDKLTSSSRRNLSPQDLREAQKVFAEEAKDREIDERIRLLKRQLEQIPPRKLNQAEIDKLKASIENLEKQILPPFELPGGKKLLEREKRKLERATADDPRRVRIQQEIDRLEKERSDLSQKKVASEQFLENIREQEEAFLNRRNAIEQRYIELKEKEIQLAEQQRIDAENQAKQQEDLFEQLKRKLTDIERFDIDFKDAENKAKLFRELTKEAEELAKAIGLPAEAQLNLARDFVEKEIALTRQDELAANQKELQLLEKQVQEKKKLYDLEKARDKLIQKRTEVSQTEADIVARIAKLREIFSEFESAQLAKAVVTGVPQLPEEIGFTRGLNEIEENLKKDKPIDNVKFNRLLNRMIKSAETDAFQGQFLRFFPGPTVPVEEIDIGNVNLFDLINGLRESFTKLQQGEVTLQKQQDEWNNIQVSIQETIDALEALKLKYGEVAQAAIEAAQNIQDRANQLNISAPPIVAPAPNPVEKALGGFIPKYFAQGFTPRGTDTIPAMLSPNEAVINAKSAQAFAPLIRALNLTRTQNLDAGGTVTYVGDIHMNFPNATDKIDYQDVAYNLRRLLRRGNIRF